jgi:hypothetical protein
MADDQKGYFPETSQEYENFIFDNHYPVNYTWEGVSPDDWSYTPGAKAGYSWTPNVPDKFADRRVQELSGLRDHPALTEGETTPTGLPKLSPEESSGTGQGPWVEPPIDLINGKKTVFGVPAPNLFSTLGRGLGSLANAMDPRNKPGQPAIDIFEHDQNRKMAAQKLGMEAEAHKENSAFRQMSNEVNQRKMDQLIKKDKEEGEQNNLLAELVGLKPNTPEHNQVMVKYIQAGGNPDYLSKLSGNKPVMEGLHDYGTTPEGLPISYHDRGPLAGQRTIPGPDGLPQAYTGKSIPKSGEIAKPTYAQALAIENLRKTLGREPTEEEKLKAVSEQKDMTEQRLPSYSNLKPTTQKSIDNLVEQVHAGEMGPSAAQRTMRTLGSNLNVAFADRYVEKYGSYPEMNLEANYNFFKNPANQKLFRQIKSTFDAMEEDKRLAKLVDNPAGTPINKLTGAAKIAFGNSQRVMLDMGNLMTVDETNRIMGGQGGAVEYFKELQKRMNPDLSVKQYMDMMDEARYYVATRWKAYAEGTPLAKNIDSWYGKIADERPFLDEKDKSRSKSFKENISRYKPIIGEMSKKYNVPPDLVEAVIGTESSGNPKAVSSKGAQGLMQLMPGTAKQYGVTDSFDQKQNIEGGTKYLSDLLKKYKGNETLALIEYNGGRLPKETLNYVQKIIKPGQAQINKDKTKIKISGRIYEVD